MPQHRAVECLHQYSRDFPGVWKLYAELISLHEHEFPPWVWCSYVVNVESDAGIATDRARMSILITLGAWRATQGIYRLHPTLLEELLKTPITGDIPHQLLERLPEWGVYVELPGHLNPFDSSRTLHGFWATYIEVDGHRILTIVEDTDVDAERTECATMVYLSGTLQESVTLAIARATEGLPTEQITLESKDAPQLAASLEGLVSVLLYLCSEEREISGELHRPPRIVRGAKRTILPAAKAPIVRECGVRIGTALDAARANSAERGAGTGASVIPHVRRAHWHTFWTGPLDGERRPVLRWLSPILVGGDITGATVRPVKGT